MPFAGETHYRKYSDGENDGTALVLIHGAGGSYLHWPSEIRRLAGENTLAIDLPGHGGSPGDGKDAIDAYVKDVIDFLDQVNISQAVIAGHSMGSAIAQQLSLEHPKRVKALILVGAGAKLRVHPGLLQDCASENTYPAAVKQVMEWSFSPQTDRRLVELAGDRMAEITPGVVYKDFLACDGFDIRDQLEKIQQPVLVICGADDQMTPVRFSKYLSGKLPEARLEIVPNAGHMVMLEQPAIVAGLIKDFLDDLRAGE